MFLEGLKRFGKRWKHISEYIKTRSVVQIRSHAQKFFKRQAKDELPVEIGDGIETDDDELGSDGASTEPATPVTPPVTPRNASISNQQEVDKGATAATVVVKDVEAN